MEFRNAVNDCSELKEILKNTEVPKELEGLKKWDETLTNMSMKVDEFERIVAKYDRKKDQVDPVTNTPRFGPVMVGKIQEFGMSVTLLKQDLEVCKGQCTTLLSTALNEASKAESHRKKVLEDQHVFLQMAEAARLAEEAEAEQKEAAEREASIAKEKEVHDAAEAIRTRKEQESIDANRQQEAAYNELVQTVAGYNAMPASTEAFAHALGRLVEDSKDEVDAQKKALATVADILANILSKPDDEKFRRLKVNSPLLQDRLLGRSGGTEVLMAAGFRAIIDKPEGYPVEPCVVLLTMSEPNPEADVMAWMAWFDGLKEKRELPLLPQ